MKHSKFMERLAITSLVIFAVSLVASILMGDAFGTQILAVKISLTITMVSFLVVLFCIAEEIA